MSTNETNWVVPLGKGELPDKSLVGGKAWSIARMTALGLRVPPAFVVTTEACNAYLANGTFPDGLKDQILAAIADLEKLTGRTFGHGETPLLVSVRSGAAISMPGMMDTVLNMGITDETEAALAAECGDAGFARNTHKRFFDLYSSIVLKAGGVEFSEDSTPADWNKQLEKAVGSAMPDSVEDRLLGAVAAVFESWNSRRAKRYRQHHGIPHDLGTAVTIQAMVFGNLDDASGTGVLFSRNPLTGVAEPYGEYLRRAQGEDVVSGKRTPKGLDDLREVSVEAYDELLEASALLERENGDMQDIEFTVQKGELFLLQSRVGKRAPAAAVRIAVDMAKEGLITKTEALERVSPEQVHTLLAPHLDEGVAESAKLLVSGEGACPGVGRGIVVMDADRAEALAAEGKSVVLARPTTSPEDVHGMIVSKAVITEAGGSTSHAAVVSRALGLPCVVGCGAGALKDFDGLEVTVEGAAGKVFSGLLDVAAPDEAGDEHLRLLADWAASESPLRVLRPEDAPEEGVVDLSAVEGGEDVTKLDGLLAGKKGAKGGALASPEGVAAAVRAKLEFIIGKPVLPLLLAAVQAGKKA